jgi:integrase/recombinase XerD
VLLNRWGLRMTRANATLLLRNVAASAQLDVDFSPHSLRRTFVSTLLDTGASLRDVQLAAGHASPNTTVLYHMTGANPDRDAAHQLASFISGIAG